jgi:lipid-A-disaccharide synthase-like uncharacterized protein
MFETGAFLAPLLRQILPWLYTDSWIWTVIGLCGNVVFGSRLIVQWLATEQKRQLTIPEGYWYLSFIGSLFSIVYAFHVDKLPIIIGNMAFLIHARNLFFMLKGKHNI